MTGNSGFLLCWPREVQSSIRVARESWGWLSSHCRAKETSSRLGPGPKVLFRVKRDLGVAFQTHLRSQAWYIGEAKNSALLLSPNGYLLSPQSGLKGVRPPVEFEERPRDALQAMQEKKAFISR